MKKTTMIIINNNMATNIQLRIWYNVRRGVMRMGMNNEE